MKKILDKQKINIESKGLTSIDEEKFTVDFVLSTEDVDRHGDIVKQDSWDLKAFKKNPVLLEQHKHDEFAIGRFTKLWIEEVKGKPALMGRVKFAVQEYDRARIAFALVKGGFMSSVSVGFQPNKVEYDEDKDVFILSENELMEVSLVSVPANTLALAKAHGIEVDKFMEKSDIKEIKETLISVKEQLEEKIEDEKEEEPRDEIVQEEEKCYTKEDKKQSRTRHAVHLLQKAIRTIDR